MNEQDMFKKVKVMFIWNAKCKVLIKINGSNDHLSHVHSQITEYLQYYKYSQLWFSFINTMNTAGSINIEESFKRQRYAIDHFMI